MHRELAGGALGRRATTPAVSSREPQAEQDWVMASCSSRARRFRSSSTDSSRPSSNRRACSMSTAAWQPARQPAFVVGVEPAALLAR